MSTLTKSTSGLLYEEKFGGNLSLIWDLVPNNLSRVSVNPDSIQILPGEERMELLMPTPANSSWVCQTHIGYAGRTATESAGCILKSITDNIAECELRGDTRDLYSYLKMELDAESIFSLKASKDGRTWSDFGNSKMLDANKIGYYMNEYTQYDSLFIYDCVICKNNFIAIEDIDPDITALVYDNIGNNITHKFVIKQENGRLLIDGSNMLFPIKYLNIKFLDKNLNIVKDVELTDIYGGDCYEFAFDIQMVIDGVPLHDDLNDLGTITGAYKLFALSITNNEPIDIIDRSLSIKAFSSYNPGNIPVKIAETTSHDIAEDLVFEKEIKLTLKAHENKNFFISIEKTIGLPLIDTEYRFKILLV